MTTFTPTVCDISHYEVVEDDGFQKAKAAGLLGIISKCTQGTHYLDPQYADYIEMAQDAGLKVGGYHFNTGEDPEAQAEYFYKNANPRNYPNFLYALDFEANSKSDMTIQQAVTFLRKMEELVGHKIVIYSGNKLKEQIDKLSDDDQTYVQAHKLWLAQYSNHATLPDGFDSYYLWQYTGDGMGNGPHWIDGITCPGNKGLDLNIYNGTNEELLASWGN